MPSGSRIYGSARHRPEAAADRTSCVARGRGATKGCARGDLNPHAPAALSLVLPSSARSRSPWCSVPSLSMRSPRPRMRRTTSTRSSSRGTRSRVSSRPPRPAPAGWHGSHRSYRRSVARHSRRNSSAPSAAAVPGAISNGSRSACGLHRTSSSLTEIDNAGRCRRQTRRFSRGNSRRSNGASP